MNATDSMEADSMEKKQMVKDEVRAETAKTPGSYRQLGALRSPAGFEAVWPGFSRQRCELDGKHYEHKLGSQSLPCQWEH